MKQVTVLRIDSVSAWTASPTTLSPSHISTPTCIKLVVGSDLLYNRAWKGILRILDFSKIWCKIQEKAKYLDRTRVLTAPWLQYLPFWEALQLHQEVHQQRLKQNLFHLQPTKGTGKWNKKHINNGLLKGNQNHRKYLKLDQLISSYILFYLSGTLFTKLTTKQPQKLTKLFFSLKIHH